ncbi:MAG: hypothetical protein A3D52_03045 [Candidatus Taylorbacteria bacterium RIFCSPHIGHO2_02_FULL_44_36]|uniref:Plasmid stabilization protein n=1 Tax=Candidatus Taylorbacteria bacterium RIFCSPLOWO2_12_FULL_44_15c TaxID=1802333 RepID=A0A1G2P6E5_9BACT|nr:MAG: hypothetical protein A3D52_03045 [Candidatus Taylorbacteria bacterium RIFCSPHIGHO2_02_FULL_44_36]OHA38094.1 MAG: hypothetical protein A3I97_01120 [Candidatus Taylorbacteria bacterium RIFCSPLOWO2_02_FULL_44_35]OHA43289.1 MAG: hypothetical protein A3G03_01670 [Candidatus Taylorbacteria bacterium RIFCSPLOWO2_12_FULL_44_15c]
MRGLIASPVFRKTSRRFLEGNPKLEQKFVKVLSVLKKDPFDSSLKTHKLHGSLSQLYACSINYNYRIVFSVGEEAVILYAVGSHDEVYKSN